MSYFTTDFVKFFKELEANNNREWFQGNKKRFEENVKNPFEAFTKDCIVEAAKIDPSIKIEPKDAVFRIYKDIRFSKDKTPYKTHLGAVISRGGRKGHEIPGYYIHGGGKDLWIGGGAYFLDKKNLQKVRQEISYNMAAFNKLVNDKKFKAIYKELKGEKNKILPKEFKEDTVKQPLLANKQFYYMAEHKPSLLTSKDLMKTVREHFKAGAALNKFLNTAIYH